MARWHRKHSALRALSQSFPLLCGVQIVFFLLASPLKADDWNAGWSFTNGCPASGTTYSGSIFSASGSSGFSGSGSCTRTSTEFTQFNFGSTSGGTLHNSTLYAHHMGDVIIFPPLLSTENAAVFAVNLMCPTANRTLNWIYVQWGSGTYSLVGGLVFGTAAYDTSTGVSVTSRNDVQGTSVAASSISLPGSCSGGTYTLSGSGDQSGGMLFTYTGSGVFKTAASRAIFFLPQKAITPSSDLGNRNYHGMYFSSLSASDARNITATSNGTGLSFTINPYSNVQNGTIDSSGSSFTDTVSFSSSNSPTNGILLGTVYRSDFHTGSLLGTGKIACIAENDQIQVKLICSGESPLANSHPYTMTLSSSLAEVLGQPTPNSYVGAEMGTSTPYQNWVWGGKYIQADAGNHRVLIWNSIPTSYTSADLVLGQPQLGTTGFGLTAQNLNGPQGASYDGTRVYVADTVNNRVLIWNSFPTANQQAANLVLGQPDMTTKLANYPSISAQTLSSPRHVSSDGTRLFVTDYSNHRVLIWNAIPTSNQIAADLVLGQPDMTSKTSNNGGLSAQTLSFPLAAMSDGSKFYVLDSGNNRVLIWNSVPTTNRQAADLVLGQPNFTTATSLTAQSLNNARGLFSDGTHFAVADSLNHRVLIWNSIPTVNQQAADIVLGQPDMTSKTSNNGGISSQTLATPGSVTSNGTKWFVADTVNRRMLIWNSMPTVNQQAPDVILGQPSGTSVGSNVESYNAQTIPFPSGVASDGTKFYASDSSRILIWNSLPKVNQQAADLVLGQPDMTSNGNLAGRSAQSLTGPSTIFSDGTRLFVADTASLRVLIWNSLPTVNQQAADIVLGQPDMTSANAPSASSQTLYNPNGVHFDGTKLYVADTYNHRVLIWNSLPTTNQQAADVVLGQPDMTTTGMNTGGVSAQSLDYPFSVYSDGTKLYVGDTFNNRILIWNSIPTANHTAADVVVGQPDMTSNGSNAGGASSTTFYNPKGVYSDGTKLYVADWFNNRVLVWNSIPTTNQKSADSVIGQPNMSSIVSNYGGISNRSLYQPWGIVKVGSRLAISDANRRVLFVPLP